MLTAVRNMLRSARAVLRLAGLCSIFVFAASIFVRAQAHTREVRLYFPFDNAVVNSAYLNNAAQLSLLDSLYNAGAFDAANSFEVVSYSSPEGNYNYNVGLSKRRANAFRNYIVKNYPALNGKITTNPCGESWEELRKAVILDGRLGNETRKSVLEIIDSDDRPDVKEARLKAIPGYKQLYANYFRRLRYAFIRVRIEKSGESAVTPADSGISDSTTGTGTAAPADTSSVSAPADTTAMHGTAFVSAPDTTAKADTTSAAPADTTSIAAAIDSTSVISAADTSAVFAADSTLTAPVDTTRASGIVFPATKPAKRMIAAVKTNLLYDAVTALNVEVEVPLGRNFSIMAEDVFPWWETGNKYCFQMWEMGLEARYWFKGWDPKGTEKLRGFFAGVYGMSSKYDFQFDRDINLQGEYWSAGISAGYCMPIGRRKRVNLEFSVAAGPMHTVFRHYQPTQSYDKLIRDPYNAGIGYQTGKWFYFYPTKAKVSLVVPINIPTGKKEVRYE